MARQRVAVVKRKAQAKGRRLRKKGVAYRVSGHNTKGRAYGSDANRLSRRLRANDRRSTTASSTRRQAKRESTRVKKRTPRAMSAAASAGHALRGASMGATSLRRKNMSRRTAVARARYTSSGGRVTGARRRLARSFNSALHPRDGRGRFRNK